MIYPWIKALHVISVIAWMAGMLYLPRLFVYHADAKPGSELSKTLKIMERRLLRRIVNPAMVATFVFGIWMLLLDPTLLQKPYMHAKLGLVLIMTGIHVFLARCRRRFAEDRNSYSSVFFRIMNEVPAVLIIGIVILIIVKPNF
jgi:putative membrane protein